MKLILDVVRLRTNWTEKLDETAGRQKLDESLGRTNLDEQIGRKQMDSWTSLSWSCEAVFYKLRTARRSRPHSNYINDKDNMIKLKPQVVEF